jgi:hypothetical protein
LAWVGAKASNEFIEFFRILFGNKHVQEKVSGLRRGMTGAVHASEKKKKRKGKTWARGLGCCGASAGPAGNGTDAHTGAVRLGRNRPDQSGPLFFEYLFCFYCFSFRPLKIAK